MTTTRSQRLREQRKDKQPMVGHEADNPLHSSPERIEVSQPSQPADNPEVMAFLKEHFGEIQALLKKNPDRDPIAVSSAPPSGRFQGRQERPHLGEEETGRQRESWGHRREDANQNWRGGRTTEPSHLFSEGSQPRADGRNVRGGAHPGYGDDDAPRSQRGPYFPYDRPYWGAGGTAMVCEDSPFAHEIRSFPIPQGFKPPTLETYTGDTDPKDHLHRFKYCMMLTAAPEPVVCQTFPTTLQGKARAWFEGLRKGSISSFAQLADIFQNRFLQRRKFGKTTAELMNIKQEEGESLRGYMERFNDESLQVQCQSEEVVIGAFINGLRSGKLYVKLVTDPPSDLQTLMNRAEKYAKGEEADRRKRDHDKLFTKKKEGGYARGGEKNAPIPRSGGLRESGGSTKYGLPRDHKGFTPLSKPRADILAILANKGMIHPPPKMTVPSERLNKTLYCRFHEQHGHDTEDCRELKRELETLIQNGHLKEFVKEAYQQGVRRGRSRERGPERRPGRLDQNDKRRKEMNDPPEEGGHRNVTGVIHSIMGGPAGGDSHSARKAMCRRIPEQEPTHKRFRPTETITFSEEDAVPNRVPHTDALLIKAIIANKEVHRVYVDDGSSVDIIYRNAYEKLGIGKERLQPCKTHLVGFAGEVQQPMGILPLPVTVGKFPKDKLIYVDFAVLDVASPYNVILGRPAMVQLKAIWSPYHLVMKFPTEEGIAVIRGDQAMARECHMIALKGKGKIEGGLKINCVAFDRRLSEEELTNRP